MALLAQTALPHMGTDDHLHPIPAVPFLWPGQTAMRRAIVPFPLQCRAVGLPEPVHEYRFHATRRWRFDFAWPDQKVALEIEGGVFIQGRHSRGAGMLGDMEKYNAAAADGWRVFRVTPKQIGDGSALTTMQSAWLAMSNDGAAA